MPPPKAALVQAARQAARKLRPADKFIKSLEEARTYVAGILPTPWGDVPINRWLPKAQVYDNAWGLERRPGFKTAGILKTTKGTQALSADEILSGLGTPLVPEGWIINPSGKVSRDYSKPGRGFPYTVKPPGRTPGKSK